jgi:hypothetical protein
LKQTANNLWVTGKDKFEQLVDWVDAVLDNIFDKDDDDDDDDTILMDDGLFQ